MHIFTPDHTNGIGCTSAGQKCAFQGFTCLVIGCVWQHVSAHLYRHVSCWQEDKEITQILWPVSWLAARNRKWLSSVLFDLGPGSSVVRPLEVAKCYYWYFSDWEICPLVHKVCTQVQSCNKYYLFSLRANNPEGGATTNSQSLTHWKVITNKWYALRLCNLMPGQADILIYLSWQGLSAFHETLWTSLLLLLGSPSDFGPNQACLRCFLCSKDQLVISPDSEQLISIRCVAAGNYPKRAGRPQDRDWETLR